MIYTDSRYANGRLYRALHPKTEASTLTVARLYPSESANFYYYTWHERDRIENIAATKLGDSNLWWHIMDYNPEIVDPINIAVGTPIRIPYGQ